jgi:hypothetical protein
MEIAILHADEENPGKNHGFGFGDRIWFLDSSERVCFGVRNFFRCVFVYYSVFGCVLRGNPGVFASVSKCVCTVSADVFWRARFYQPSFGFERAGRFGRGFSNAVFWRGWFLWDS